MSSVEEGKDWKFSDDDVDTFASQSKSNDSEFDDSHLQITTEEPQPSDLWGGEQSEVIDMESAPINLQASCSWRTAPIAAVGIVSFMFLVTWVIYIAALVLWNISVSDWDYFVWVILVIDLPSAVLVFVVLTVLALAILWLVLFFLGDGIETRDQKVGLYLDLAMSLLPNVPLGFISLCLMLMMGTASVFWLLAAIIPDYDGGGSALAGLLCGLSVLSAGEALVILLISGPSSVLGIWLRVKKSFI